MIGRITLCAIASVAIVAMASAPALAQSGDQQDPRLGYWWYVAPPPPPTKPDPNGLEKPVIPPMAELATWTPPKIHRLIEQATDVLEDRRAIADDRPQWKRRELPL